MQQLSSLVGNIVTLFLSASQEQASFVQDVEQPEFAGQLIFILQEQDLNSVETLSPVFAEFNVGNVVQPAKETTKSKDNTKFFIEIPFKEG